MHLHSLIYCSVYADLADHFRKEHFLCEEGKCATEEFTGAFRNEIEYKAHVASVHGKTLNKQQAKQTRTLQLEITLGPRGQGISNMRSRWVCSTIIPLLIKFIFLFLL